MPGIEIPTLSPHHAAMAERERCAKIAETFPDDVMVLVDRPGGPPGNFYRKAEKQDIADAIRRG